MKVLYGKHVLKLIKKHRVPYEVWTDFRDAFQSFALSQNFRIHDIKKMIHKGGHAYYRMRIRNYRALFRMDADFIYVEDLGPRGGIYKP